MNSLKLVLFPFLALGSVACSSDDSDSGSGRHPRPGDGMSASGGSSSLDDSESGYGGSEADLEGPYTVFEDFTIPINQTITVGSFDIHLTEAEVRSGGDSHEYPDILFRFTADNLDDESQLPLRNYTLDRLILEIDGKYFEGLLSEENYVPGYRAGENIFWWRLDDPDLTVDQIMQGTVTIGSGSSNKVVIPLAAPEDTVTLKDIPLEPFELTDVQHGHRIEVSDPHVQFSSRSRNELLEEDTAWLVLEGTLYGGDTFSCMKADDVYITYPNGLSIVAVSAHNCVHPMTTEDFLMIFELEAPIPGTYEITIEDDQWNEGDVDTTFKITIPK